MGTKWRGNTGSLGLGYLILIKSANLDAEQLSAENVAAVISSCMRISMLVWCWHLFVNVGCELCSSDLVSSIVLRYFRALMLFLPCGVLTFYGQKWILISQGCQHRHTFLFIFIMLFCSCSTSFHDSSKSANRMRGDSSRFIKTSHATEAFTKLIFGSLMFARVNGLPMQSTNTPLC